MAEGSTASASRLSERSQAVALITLARYLADRDPNPIAYLQASLDHARASSLTEADVAALQLLVGSIGDRPQQRDDRVSRGGGPGASAR